MPRAMVFSPDRNGLIALRRAEPADAERLHVWRSEASTRRYQPVGSISVESLRDQLAIEARATVDPRLDEGVRWIVEAAEGPVG